MKTSLSFLIGLFLVLTHVVTGQNIYKFNLQKLGDGYTLSNAKLLTGFNKGGINTDPSFMQDGKLLIVSNHFDKNQLDVLQLDIARKTITRITHTDVTERYPVELGDKTHFSTILKEQSGTSFHKYPLDRSSKGSTIAPNLRSLNAYAWVRFGECYILEGKGVNRLSFVDLVDSSNGLRMLDNVGESIQVDKYKNLVFTQKLSANNVLLKKYDVKRKEYKTYSKTIDNTQIIAYTQDHKVLAASGSKLYVFNLAATSIWEEVADLSKYGINKVGQLLVNKGQLIVVDKS